MAGRRFSKLFPCLLRALQQVQSSLRTFTLWHQLLRKGIFMSQKTQASSSNAAQINTGAQGVCRELCCWCVVSVCVGVGVWGEGVGGVLGRGLPMTDKKPPRHTPGWRPVIPQSQTHDPLSWRSVMEKRLPTQEEPPDAGWWGGDSPQPPPPASQPTNHHHGHPTPTLSRQRKRQIFYEDSWKPK